MANPFSCVIYYLKNAKIKLDTYLKYGARGPEDTGSDLTLNFVICRYSIGTGTGIIDRSSWVKL